MDNNELELKSIAMEYLFEGMELAEDIYTYDKKLLLLAKGEVITANQIEQLKEFNTYHRNISVFASTYEMMIKHSGKNSNSLAQNCLEEKVGYTKIKDKAHEFLNNIEQTKVMSKQETDSIADEMSDRLYSIDPSLIFQCINAPNPLDEYLRRHSINVGFINGLMGRWLNLSEENIGLLIMIGLVHDVGKTKIPVEILNAPRKLTISEFEIMKMHTVYSYDLLGTDERFTEPIRLAARHHHEKMNGSGYPDRLNSEQISLFAKITAVSDIYDAMVSKRFYKEANSPFMIISKLSDKQFSELDMKLVHVFTEHMPSELLGKPVLLSDNSIGTIKFIFANQFEYPLVEVNGIIKKTDKNLHCIRMVFDE